MSFIVRILLAILLGVLATSLLDWLGVLTHTINVLIGVIVALAFYFGYDK